MEVGLFAAYERFLAQSRPRTQMKAIIHANKKGMEVNTWGNCCLGAFESSKSLDSNIKSRVHCEIRHILKPWEILNICYI